MAERDFKAIYAKRKAAGDPNVLYRTRGGSTIALDAALADRLAEAAQERDVSQAGLARKLLIEALDMLRPVDEFRLSRKRRTG